MPAAAFEPPAADCPLCPRLARFRRDNRKAYPAFYNGAVPSFGSLDASLLVVGLAPGLKGANRTGRPFTGDYAGDLLYPTLVQHGWASGSYRAEVGDVTLKGCRITNSVRCVPPQNRPESSESATCLPFLRQEIAAMPNLKVILALGTTAHKAVLKALRHKQSAYPFAHGRVHAAHPYWLIDSYHCSRYNTNTGRLTTAMFNDVITTLTPLTKDTPCAA